MKKVIVGNDQHIWRKTLAKELKKSESKKKSKNKKHEKNMMWFDRESKMPTIINYNY